jgi:predicted nucleic acid-binding protein
MTSQVCADAGLVLRWILPTDQDAEAEALLKSWDEAGTEIVAPPSLDAEVTSVIRILVFAGNLLPGHGEEAYRLFRELGISIVSPADLSEKAWRMAAELNLARTYSAQYLALAGIVDCELWTADRKLFDAVKDRSARVHVIGGGKEPPAAKAAERHRPPGLDEAGLWRAF